jgi:hypothetical protein
LKQFLRLPNSKGVPREYKEAVISGRKLILPRACWAAVGSPVCLVKDAHPPTGDLHLVPTNGTDPEGYRVDLGADRRVVRIYVSAQEALCLKPGRYTPEVTEALGRTVIILRGVYIPPAWRRAHGA